MCQCGKKRTNNRMWFSFGSIYNMIWILDDKVQYKYSRTSSDHQKEHENWHNERNDLTHRFDCPVTLVAKATCIERLLVLRSQFSFWWFLDRREGTAFDSTYRNTIELCLWDVHEQGASASNVQTLKLTYSDHRVYQRRLLSTHVLSQWPAMIESRL